MKAPAPIGRECLKADVTLPSHHCGALVSAFRAFFSGQIAPSSADGASASTFAKASAEGPRSSTSFPPEVRPPLPSLGPPSRSRLARSSDGGNDDTLDYQ